MRFTRNHFLFWLAIICAIMLSEAKPRAQYMNFGPRTYEPSSSPYSYWRRPPGGLGTVGPMPGANIRCLNGYGGQDFRGARRQPSPLRFIRPHMHGGLDHSFGPIIHATPILIPIPIRRPARHLPSQRLRSPRRRPQGMLRSLRRPVPTAARRPNPLPSKPPPPAAVVKHEAPPPPLRVIQPATPCLREVNAAKYFGGGNDDARSFQNVKRRIAFFAFDDPYNTGLGEIISSIHAQDDHMLDSRKRGGRDQLCRRRCGR